ncbi:MAG TPA: protein-glutamate O-methyltransferase CheR [Thermoanaerobaculia bacterium]|nr:protein-glutamate O-methyltransferase CheR [Thermoanaerobaculia bacterium]
MDSFGMHAITTKEFRLFQSLVHREAGINLSDQKRALLVGRVGPRVRALALPSFGAYYDRVVADRDELVRLIDSVCTNETHFFREPKQFAFLENEWMPALRRIADAGHRRRETRIWSAGCSTGEEPFSIAMSLLAHLPEWKHEIVASDLSTKVLAKAEAAIWPMERIAHVPVHYRKTFLLRGSGSQEGRAAARDELRSLIRFCRVNLHHDSYPLTGRFDAIFCRNVLIYFDAETKRRIIHRLLDRLEPHGLLFLGHSESLSGFDRVRVAGPTVYALREGR